MTQVYADLRFMGLTLFAILVLWLLKKVLGNSALDTIKTVLAEIRQLAMLKSERGAVNMIGGLVLAAALLSMFVSDQFGKMLLLGQSAPASPSELKAVLGIVGVSFIGGFFLICAAMVQGPKK